MTIESEIEKFLYCSTLLERKVAEVYEHIANLINDKTIKFLFMYITCNSFKHTECFRLMAELFSYRAEACSENCLRVWGESWLTIVKDTKKILEKTAEIDFANLSLLIDGLERIERFTAEEYLTVLHARLISWIIEERGGASLNHLKTVLNWIIEDEDKHKQILETIKNLTAKSQ